MPFNAVIGAGGKTGFQCVKKFAAKGGSVKAVVRDPKKYEEKFQGLSGDISLTSGNVCDVESLKSCLDGATNVIFAASRSDEQTSVQVDKEGLVNVADVCKEIGVERLVVVSSGLVDPKNSENEIRLFLNKNGVMDAKYEGEEYVRKSGLAYTVVRPGGLKDDDGGVLKLVTLQGDEGKPGSISREDVASVCVAAIDSPATVGATFEIWSAPEGGDQQSDLNELFADLKKDNA